MTFEEAKAIIDSYEEARDSFGVEVESTVCSICNRTGCPVAEKINDGIYYITECKHLKRN